MEDDANIEKEKMERVTEAIFGLLYHNGDMSLENLKNRVEAAPHFFDMAIGALVEKDDIQLLRDGDAVTVRRTSPALAVFPFRSN